MSVTIPVYSEQGGVPHIEIFSETDEGSFRRTSAQPFTLLNDNIVGITHSHGKIVTSRYARGEEKWSSPTVKLHSGRPQSLYRFLREQFKQRRLYLFSAPSLNGRLMELDVVELKLKNHVSSRVRSMFIDHYVQAVSLLPEPPQQPGRNDPSAAALRLRERLHGMMGH